MPGPQTAMRLAEVQETVLEEDMEMEWWKTVERVENGEEFNEKDIQVREAKLVDPVATDS